MTGCNLCGSAEVEILIEFGSHPIAHQLLAAPDAEEYTHEVRLGFCTACGLTQLVDPIPPERLYSEYNWLSSWKFNPHQEPALDAIAALPGIERDAFVLEAGSNDGSFLAGLARRGFTNVLGLEPASDALEAAAAAGVETVAGYLTPEAARTIVEQRGQCSVFIARQVLEHVGDLPAFGEAMRTLLAPDAHVLIEVPDFGFNQKATDYSAIWEEHVNHFTAATLARFLGSVGVEVERFETAVFSGQALIAWGRATGGGVSETIPATLQELSRAAHGYRDRWPGFRAAMADYLEAQRAGGRRVALYGAGCRSILLVNYCGLAPLIECAFDDQPEKLGRFMPGSRLAVRPGDELVGSEVDLCLLAVNAENEDRVIERREAFAARGGEFVSVHPPSPRLPDFWDRA